MLRRLFSLGFIPGDVHLGDACTQPGALPAVYVCHVENEPLICTRGGEGTFTNLTFTSFQASVFHAHGRNTTDCPRYVRGRVPSAPPSRRLPAPKLARPLWCQDPGSDRRPFLSCVIHRCEGRWSARQAEARALRPTIHINYL